MSSGLCKIGWHLRMRYLNMATPVKRMADYDAIREQDNTNPAYRAARLAYQQHIATCPVCSNYVLCDTEGSKHVI